MSSPPSAPKHVTQGDEPAHTKLKGQVAFNALTPPNTRLCPRDNRRDPLVTFKSLVDITNSSHQKVGWLTNLCGNTKRGEIRTRVPVKKDEIISKWI